MSDVCYLDYDRSEFDAQYNNRARFPFYTDYFSKWSQWSGTTREKLHGHLDIAYETDRTERLDIFPAARTGAPIHVVVHGGTGTRSTRMTSVLSLRASWRTA